MMMMISMMMMVSMMMSCSSWAWFWISGNREKLQISDKLTKIAPETTPTKMTNRRVDSANQNADSVAKLLCLGMVPIFFVAIIKVFDVTFSL